MASSKNDPKMVVISPDPKKNMNIDEMVEILRRIHLSSYGKETKILTNKRSLEECLKNLPEECPVCKIKFKENNFYLVDINDTCGSEIYVKCICGDYREVIKEYDG